MKIFKLFYFIVACCWFHTIWAQEVEIKVDPGNVVETGELVTFTAVATGGTDISYAWKKGSTTVGTNDETYAIASALTSDAATYTCVATIDGSDYTSNPITLTVSPTGPTITGPTNQSVTAPEAATFTVSATAKVGGTLSYQWQKQDAGGGGFSDILGANEASYGTEPTTTNNDGDQFQCIVSEVGNGSSTSSAASLSVTASGPTISDDPDDATVTAPATASFSVSAAAQAGGALSYQWQKKSAGGSTFEDIASATLSSYETPATTMANNGDQFQCVVSEVGNGSTTSGIATLTVTASGPSITDDPDDATVTAPATASFSVSAAAQAGGALSYQWQKKSAGGSTFEDIPSATLSSYETPATTMVNNGDQFQCVVNEAGNGSATSDIATLTVTASGPSITDHPDDETVTVPQTATFTVSATAQAGGTLTYQWQKKSAGASNFEDINDATDPSYTTDATTTVNNQEEFRCVVSEVGNGSTPSDAATLTVTPSNPSIDDEPDNATVVVPAQATFSLVASARGGGALSYQWQRKSASGGDFEIIGGATESSYETPATTLDNNGDLFRCIVSEVDNGSVTSSEATLTVNPQDLVLEDPENQKVTVGNPALTFTLNAQGGIPPYTYTIDSPEIPANALNGAVFSWAPNDNNAGSHTVTFTVKDKDEQDTDSKTITITVYESVNLASPGDQFVIIGNDLAFTLAATGGEGNKTYTMNSIPDLPAGAILDGNTGEFSWSPTAGQDNEYTVTFTATDQSSPQASNGKTITIDVNKQLSVTDPRDTTINHGEDATFRVIAHDGNETYTYQWQRKPSGGSWADVTVGAGQTESTYSFQTAYPGDNNALYRCIVNDNNSTDTSGEATLAVKPPPIVVNVTITPSSTVAGADVQFTANAGGGSNSGFSYSWTKVNDPSFSQTERTFTLEDVTVDHSGTYTCTVTDDASNSGSGSATLSVGEAFAIDQHPTNLDLTETQRLNFEITLTGGTTPYQYQWQKDGIDIPNAESSEYTKSDITVADAGKYRCIVTDNNGNGTTLQSNEATLAVSPRVNFTQNPEEFYSTVGQPASFTIAVTGGKPLLRFQWRKYNDPVWEDVSGATSTTLSFTSVARSNRGYYRCRVTDANNAVFDSEYARLYVYRALNVTTHPQSAARLVGQSVTFSFAFEGGREPHTFQWQKDGVNIPNANEQDLVITNIELSDGGNYKCIIGENNGTSTETNSARLSVNPNDLSIIESPTDESRVVGQSVTLTVSATGGEPPYQYVWEKRVGSGQWNEVYSSIDPEYTIASVALSDSGYYHCKVVDDEDEEAVSQAARLRVYPIVTISPHPQPQTKWTGDSVVFTVGANGGNGSYSYRWMQDGSYITGANSPTLVRRDLITGNGGVYRCRVRSLGYTVFSDTARLTVYQTARITEHPDDATVNPNEQVTFSIEAIGQDPLNLQWQKNGINLTGATSATLNFHAVSQSDEGTYRCIATNGGGSDTSRAAQLRITGPATVTTDPIDDTVFTGDTLAFSILAGGSIPITYQWQKNRQNISGATTNNYTKSPVTLADSGLYRCIASNSQGNDASKEARLTVFQTVVINSHPDSVEVNPGDTVTLAIAAEGQVPISYQWEKDGHAIPNATNPQLVLKAIVTNQAGLYRCKAINGGGEVYSKPALVSVRGPAVVISNPRDTTLWTKQNMQFTVVTSGSSPILFQWQKDGINILGGTNQTLPLDSLSIDDAGKYRCVVENQLGADTSTAAKLTLLETVSISKQPDSIDAYEGDTVFFSITATGKDTIYYQWVKNGFIIPGATKPILTLTQITSADIGAYQCIATNGGGSDTSTIAPLHVSGVGLILTVPNGGEIWKMDSTHQIAWKTPGNIDSIPAVKIEFSTTGGSSWSIITDSTPNTGTYSWKVPITLTDFCKIRISDAVDEFPADESDSLFSIKSIIAIIQQNQQKKVAISLVDKFLVTPKVSHKDQPVAIHLMPNKEIAEYRIRIFDPLGNMVYSFDSPISRFVKGKMYTIAKWDKRNRYGRRVAGGSYLVVGLFKNRAGEVSQIKRMIGVRK